VLHWSSRALTRRPCRTRAAPRRRRSYILTAAKLIAPVLDAREWEAGYAWVVDALKAEREALASQMEVEKALHHLRTRQFDRCVRARRRHRVSW
jgi:hypothetical protein